VKRAKQYITTGDIFQVVLSRRVRRIYSGDLFAVYRALRMINPSPYLFYLDFGETKLAGSSPEVLVRLRDRVVEVLPIAGTRRRGVNAEEDEILETELLADAKELAEHVMLVDLGAMMWDALPNMDRWRFRSSNGGSLLACDAHRLGSAGRLRSGFSAMDTLEPVSCRNGFRCPRCGQ
jgi:hypothetical protein